jgi:hypothetical protein
MGVDFYPHLIQLFATADSGGSNGFSKRLWKVELQKLANSQSKVIHVSHYPPYTHKWNKIEHRMFNAISENWRGIPLTDYETIVSGRHHTTTEACFQFERYWMRESMRREKISLSYRIGLTVNLVTTRSMVNGIIKFRNKIGVIYVTNPESGYKVIEQSFTVIFSKATLLSETSKLFCSSS